jgi:hypothetical protein
MQNDRENILSALREKPLKVYEIMKRANVVNEEACQDLTFTRKGQSEQTFLNWRAELRPLLDAVLAHALPTITH